ncbi:MAG: DUF6065 family protein [Pseudomonadota bacterium]
MTAPVPLPPNTVRACLVEGADVDPADHLRVAKATRDWMDRVPQKYIYRCIPLIAANTMGWELLNPVDTVVGWTGGPSNTDVIARSASPNRFGAVSHFGAAIVTWYIPFVFRTSPDLGLIVAAPSNHELADAVPLDAFVRTDWLPFPFTLNWRITRARVDVAIPKRMPLARILPYPLALLDETRLEIAEVASDPGFRAEVEAWGKARASNVAKAESDVAEWLSGGAEPTGDGVWNQQYVRAQGAEGAGYAPHQTIFKPRRPEDRRKG